MRVAAAVTTDREAVVTLKEDLQILEDVGLPFNDDGFPTSTAGVLKITSVELVAPLANDDGHHSAYVAVATDHQLSDLGQTSSHIVDPQPISVIPGISKPSDDGQIDQHTMDVCPQSDDHSLSSLSTSHIKGADSYDADDNDDDTPAGEHFEDAQEVLDSYEPAKRDHSSGSSSDDSPQWKHGKIIGARLLNMAMAVLVPSDDDDDEAQDANMNNPKTPNIVAESHSLATDLDVTDYPLTQLTQELKSQRSASQSASSVFGTHRITKPSSRGASDV